MDNLLFGILVLAIIFLSTAFHELMHAYVSYILGDDTAAKAGRLSLNPLVHIDPFMSIALPFILIMLGGPVFGAAKPVPFNPSRVRWYEKGAALVAAAGPLSNFLLAVALGLPLRYIGLDGGVISTILTYSVVINIGFGVFNLIPLPPLDGSRILYAFSPDSVRDILNKIESLGIFLILAIVLLFSGPLFLFMSIALNLIFTLITGFNLSTLI